VDRILPCFVNGPVCPSREVRCGEWGRLRCCTRAGNLTVLLERIHPVGAKFSGAAPPGSGVEDSPGRELWLVMGPYWPFCLVLTANLIVVIPVAVCILLWRVLQPGALLFLLGFAGLTLAALGSVSCRDPGLVPHCPNEPLASKLGDRNARPSPKWIFNDLARTWRPRGATYDKDVVRSNECFAYPSPFLMVQAASLCTTLPCHTTLARRFHALLRGS